MKKLILNLLFILTVMTSQVKANDSLLTVVTPLPVLTRFIEYTLPELNITAEKSLDEQLFERLTKEEKKRLTLFLFLKEGAQSLVKSTTTDSLLLARIDSVLQLLRPASLNDRETKRLFPLMWTKKAGGPEVGVLLGETQTDWDQGEAGPAAMYTDLKGRIYINSTVTVKEKFYVFLLLKEALHILDVKDGKLNANTKKKERLDLEMVAFETIKKVFNTRALTESQDEVRRAYNKKIF